MKPGISAETTTPSLTTGAPVVVSAVLAATQGAITALPAASWSGVSQTLMAVRPSAVWSQA